MTREKHKAWWDTQKDRYPFHAIAPVSVKPDRVGGNHVSCLYQIGWRIWGFKTSTERDLFLDRFTKGIMLQ